MRSTSGASTTSSLSTTRGLALLGGSIGIVLFLAVGVAVGAVPRAGGTSPTAAPEAAGAAFVRPGLARSDRRTCAGRDRAADHRRPGAQHAPHDGTVDRPEGAGHHRRRARRRSRRRAPTPPPAPPAPPKLPPGQRVNPTSAQVQAAIAQLHQRIPLFQPNESQLRTFADAVCTSFDQGQSFGQVQATVQQAVSNVQGASLSAPDAEFAVRTVLELRCPGWLP